MTLERKCEMEFHCGLQEAEFNFAVVKLTTKWGHSASQVNLAPDEIVAYNLKEVYYGFHITNNQREQTPVSHIDVCMNGV